LRAKGLSYMRFPFFVHAQFVTSFLLLLAFPPLEAAAVLQLMDRVAGTSFFLPSGLVVSGQALGNAGGGNPLLWQHLFWFLAHPEVYVLILPAMGIVAEIIANNTRKPLWGYKSMVFATVFLGFMSFMVWAHHMFLTGMGTTISAFFQTTTMIISIPSVIILSSLFISLWGGAIRFNIHLHDTYYVIGHFHYVVAPGTIFAMFAGIYYWFPKATGRKLNDFWGKVHFWVSFVCINGIFFPMFAQGLAGVSRRLYDGGMQYAHAKQIASQTNPFMSNFFYNAIAAAMGHRDEALGSNPWQATTLDWAATTSPPLAHGNFEVLPVVYRGPYEYSVPGETAEFIPQHVPVTEPAPRGGGLLPATAVAMREN
jgi:cytochrome c oxidase subunit 1